MAMTETSGSLPSGWSNKVARQRYRNKILRVHRKTYNTEPQEPRYSITLETETPDKNTLSQ